MSSVKNIVKVMNFHSLIRVDKSKRDAAKYFTFEKELKKTIYKIFNNRNLKIDKKVNLSDEKGITLNIYIGNDLGFCGNFNSQLHKAINEDKDSYKILIGKKLFNVKDKNLLFKIEKDQFYDYYPEIEKMINEMISKKSVKEINVIFNYYHSISEITFEKKRVFPVNIEDIEGDMKDEDLTSDFVIEMDVNKLLTSFLVLYICYYIKIYEFNSLASENVMRERVTRESIQKIEEKEAEDLKELRKKKKQESFKKQIDSLKRIY